ncbi:type II secretion system F family protein [Candidatus Sumerlaeota bacterium]|nr:type II secretion system F family protein [Candidatus Sumerlaeota bacterium]
MTDEGRKNDPKASSGRFSWLFRPIVLPWSWCLPGLRKRNLPKGPPILDLAEFLPFRPPSVALATLYDLLARCERLGIPMDRMLGSLGYDWRSEPTLSAKVRPTARRLLRSLEQGHTLSEAMEKNRRLFRDYEIEAVRSGETSGNLSKMLSNLAATCRSVGTYAMMAKSAIMYPLTVLIVTGSIIAGIAYFVLPRLADIFMELGAPLPHWTRWLIRASEGVAGEGGIVALLAILLVAVLLRLGVRACGVSGRIPLLGGWFVSPDLPRFFLALGAQLDARAAAPEAIRTAGAVSGTRRGRAMAGRVAGRVERGVSIADAMLEERIVPLPIRRLIHLAECNEDLAGQCLRVSEWMIDDSEERLRRLTSMMEPIMIVSMGSTIAFVALAIYTPMFYLPTYVGIVD